MRRTNIRKAGLAFCIALTLLSGLPVAVTPLPAAAQGFDLADIVNNTNNPTNLGQALSRGLAQGRTPQELSEALFTGGMNETRRAQITSLLGTLSRNSTANGNSTAALLTGLASGRMNLDAATLLGSVPNLGNLSATEAVGMLLNNPNLATIMSAMDVVSASAFVEQFLGVVPSLEGLQELATQAGLDALTAALQARLPDWAALFGDNLQGVLNGAIQGLIGMAGQIGGPALAAILGEFLGSITGGLGTIGGAITSACCGRHRTQIPQHYQAVQQTVTTQFEQHRTWMVTTFWTENLLRALGMFAEQMTATGMFQVHVIGTFLDAKHQLETQRIFQQLMAQAHKDYHPSEGMCTFGTMARSLVASERRSDLAQTVLAQRMNQRQSLSGRNIAREHEDSDTRSRLAKFQTTYCSPADNSNGLRELCPNPGAVARRNIDVDYTRNIESRLTLDLDFMPNQGASTPDEEDVFALSANLFSHNIAPRIPPIKLGDGTGRIREDGAHRYMDLRSVFAKRSVAENSFAALTAMRARGDEGAAPYAKALIRELGVADVAQIEAIIGENPSYFAQMELLTKKIYQNPSFYTELYDKPVNVERKSAAMQAIGLMQDRDLYDSLLRSEVVLSVLLETMLQKEQDKVRNALGNINEAGGSQ